MGASTTVTFGRSDTWTVSVAGVITAISGSALQVNVSKLQIIRASYLPSYYGHYNKRRRSRPQLPNSKVPGIMQDAEKRVDALDSDRL